MNDIMVRLSPRLGKYAVDIQPGESGGMRRLGRISCLPIFAAVLAAVLMAAPPEARADDDGGALVLGAGYTDPIKDDTAAADFRADYRHGKGLWFIKPWLGIEATSEGSVWGGGGIYIDLPVYDRVFFTVSTGVGGYRQGGGKDLGHTLEFRSQAEVTYRFANGTCLGAGFSHISNANIGDENPGQNVVSALYVVPLGNLLPD